MAQTYINGKTCYFIRESYPHGNYFLSRNLIELGPDPGRFIVYPGGNSFYIDASIEDRINVQGREADPEVLEDIFWRFLRPSIRRALEPFRNREMRHRSGRKKWQAPEKPDPRIHLFDKRRYHFLKFGRTDQRGLSRLPNKMFRLFLNKSRDEIEQMFMSMERKLPIREYKIYMFVSFNLQHRFAQSVARDHPQMLNQTEVDEHFITQICLLNTDPLFWSGMSSPDRLNDYLVRYVLMYFDYDYGPSSFMEDYLRQFINSRRDYRPPSGSNNMSLKEASAIFGRSKEELKKMSTAELIRRYRQKAQKIHPDKGGDHDKFVQLTEAYQKLLRNKH